MKTAIKKTIEVKRVYGIGYLHCTGKDVVFEGITAEQISALNRAIGNRRCTQGNPTGVSFYYDLDQAKPFRIADDQYGESFATYEELLAACEEWEFSDEAAEAETLHAEKQAEWDALTRQDVTSWN